MLFSGGRTNYSSDGGRRGYEPEVYGRLYWDCKQQLDRSGGQGGAGFEKVKLNHVFF